MRELEPFRPMTALGISLPGAIFWSVLASWFIPPAIANIPPFSIATSMSESWMGFAAMVAFGSITPISNGLAIVYAIQRKGYDVVRRCFLIFNVASLIGLPVVAKLILDS
jgi:hypothetical protein